MPDAIVELCRDLSLENLNEVTRLLTQKIVENKESATQKELKFSSQHDEIEFKTSLTSEESNKSIKSSATI